MTREEVYKDCKDQIMQHNSLLLELSTGFGKTRGAIETINYLCDTVYRNKDTTMLLLVAKNVHKQTWKDEFEKWGGIKVGKVIIECYESLKKHADEKFTFLVMDEVHHVKSDVRLDLLKTLKFDYMLGLSATIPKNLKLFFKYAFHSHIISCDILEAIEDDVLPEPQILLFPLDLDNSEETETIEINPKVKGTIVKGRYRDIWKLKKQKVHAIVSCTQAQKYREMSSLIDWQKNRYIRTRSKIMENVWLHQCGLRLEFLAFSKNPIIKKILKRLSDERTITFCKTIGQAEILGKNCIHSKNGKSTEVYNDFNNGDINHITAVNILNENANLVNCKYAVFANLSSSEVVIPQRLGRSMRHKSPVIIVPYFRNTREAEIVNNMFQDYKKDYIKLIHSINEIK